jgi:hypothetical protein
MLLFVILLIAIIIAFFGMIAFIRTAKASAIILGVLMGGLIFVRALGPKLIAIINLGAQFAQVGGLAALTGSDPGKGLSDAFAKLKQAPGPIDPKDPVLFYLLLIYIFVAIGVGIGSLKSFRLQGRYSYSGLLLGLIAGYIVAAYTIAAIFPESAILPLPVTGIMPQAQAAIAPATVGPAVSSKFLEFLGDLANSPSIPIIIAAAIVLFIFVATRLSARKG